MTFGKAKRIYAGEELGGIRYSDTRCSDKICSKLRRTAAFRLLHRPNDVGIQIDLRVFEDKWLPGKAHAFENIDAPRQRTLMQPEGCGPCA
jgi:hypothetical protein